VSMRNSGISAEVGASAFDSASLAALAASSVMMPACPIVAAS
jgi:hypothetical protein